jgi:hypothetical protein
MEGFSVILDDRPFEQRRSKAFFIGDPVLAVVRGSMLPRCTLEALADGYVVSEQIVGGTRQGQDRRRSRAAIALADGDTRRRAPVFDNPHSAPQCGKWSMK